MKRVVTRIMIGGMLLSGALTGGGARAADATACQVTGSVSLVDRNTSLPSALSDVQRKAAYKFIDTNILCVGTISGNYRVTAQGTTTGYLQSNPSLGDDCTSAKNDTAYTNPSGVSYNNEFTATKLSGDPAAPATLIGQVLFTRVGGLVNVSGSINNPANGSGADYTYAAELNFTPGNRVSDLPSPDGNQLAGCGPNVPGGVTTAALDGVALLYVL